MDFRGDVGAMHLRFGELIHCLQLKGLAMHRLTLLCFASLVMTLWVESIAADAIEPDTATNPGSVLQANRNARERAQIAIDVVHEALAEALPPDQLRLVIADLRDSMLPQTAIDPNAEVMAAESGDDIGIAEIENLRPISKSRSIVVKNVPEKRLPALNVQQLLAQDRHRELSGQKSRRIGVGRDLRVDINHGAWTRVAEEGWLWIADVVAEGAIGVRLHFAKFDLPSGASVTVYSPDEAVVAGPYEARGPLHEGEFWTPTIVGERVRIEYFVSAGAGANAQQRAQRRFIIDDLQHMYTDPFKVGGQDGVGACHNDIKCFPGWPTTGKAVGRISYIEDGDSFVCSGQLVNSLNGDFTPYFLTARHCIDSNPVAQTAEVFWKYETSACDGAPPSIFAVPTSNVCSLVKSGSAADYTLLIVEGKLPKGLTWVGWMAGTVMNGTAVACIHHPGGSYKRISFGTKSDNPSCGSANSFLRVDWTDGPTEPGSSGSGAFRVDNKQLIGLLSCGSSACDNLTNDSYGAFSAFYPAIASYLEGGSDDWLDDNDWCSAARTVTAGTYDDLVVKQVDPDWYRVFVPAGKRLTVTVSFTHAHGNINLNLYRLCNTDPLATAGGGGNVENVTHVNDGGGTYFRFRVNVSNDPRNEYNMVVAITDP